MSRPARVTARIALFALAGAAAAMPAHAASFDCAKASSVPEKLICGSATLGALDRENAGLYVRLLESDAVSRDAYRSDQRQWLRTERDRCASAECVSLAIWQRSGVLRTTLERTRVRVADIPEVAPDAQVLEQMLAQERSRSASAPAAPAAGKGAKESSSGPEPRAVASAGQEAFERRRQAALRAWGEESDRRARDQAADQLVRLRGAMASMKNTPSCNAYREAMADQQPYVIQARQVNVSAYPVVEGLIAEARRMGCL